MSIKGQGQGGIYYDKSRKLFIATYYERELKTGESKRKRKTFKTKEEAENFKKNLMYQQENPIFIENNGLPLGKLMEINLENKMKSNLISKSQYERVQATQRKISQTYLYNKKIDEIKSDEIQDYLNSLTNLSNSSIKKIKEQFTQSFKFAIDRGYISKNPMATVIIPRSDKLDKKVRSLTIEEEKNFVGWLLSQNPREFKFRNIYLIQMFCGLRISEVLALKRADINLREKKINVDKTLVTLPDKSVYLSNRPKTKAGIRKVPYPPTLEPFLIEQLEISKEAKNNNQNMLFKVDNSEFVNRAAVNDTLKRVLKNNFGITGISTHSLRHTYGTRRIEAGVQPNVVQKNMGHADIGVTLNVYADVFDEYKQKEQEKANKYYLTSVLDDDSKRLINNMISGEQYKRLESPSKDIEKEK